MSKNHCPPLSCKNSERAITGKVNKFTEFFNQKAQQAKTDKEKQTSLVKRKSSSNNNSVEKKKISTEIKRSPSGKELPFVVHSNEQINLIVSQLQFSNISLTDNNEQSRVDESIDNNTSLKQRRSTLPDKKEYSNSFNQIFKSEYLETNSESINNMPDNQKEIPPKLQLDLELINNQDDEEELTTQKTNLNNIEDSLKKTTPTNHDIVFQYNRQFDNFDVIKLFKDGFSIYGEDSNKKNYIIYSINQENNFEIKRDFNKSMFNTIESQSDIKKDEERSPFCSETSNYDHHDFDLNIPKLKEIIIRKWNKENNISKQDNNFSLEISRHIFDNINIDKVVGFYIVPNVKNINHYISSVDFEIIPISIKTELIINWVSEINIPSVSIKGNLSLQKCTNEFFSYCPYKTTCGCLNEWRKDFKTDLAQNFELNLKDLDNQDKSLNNFKSLDDHDLTIHSSTSFNILLSRINYSKEENIEQFSIYNSIKVLYSQIQSLENIQFNGSLDTGVTRKVQTDSNTFDLAKDQEEIGINTIKKLEFQISNFDHCIKSETNLIKNLIEKEIQTDTIELKVAQFEEIFIDKIKLNNPVIISSENCQRSLSPINCSKMSENYQNENTVTNSSESYKDKHDYNSEDRIKVTDTKLYKEETNPSCLNLQSSREGSSKYSESTSPEKENLRCSKEVKPFNSLIDKYESEFIIQKVEDSVFFTKEQKKASISNVEMLSIFRQEKLDLNIKTNIEMFQIIRKEKRFIKIEEYTLDIWRSLKISVFTMLNMIIIFIILLSIISHINISQNFTKNYFRNQSLFKWELIYSGN